MNQNNVLWQPSCQLSKNGRKLLKLFTTEAWLSDFILAYSQLKLTFGFDEAITDVCRSTTTPEHLLKYKLFGNHSNYVLISGINKKKLVCEIFFPLK